MIKIPLASKEEVEKFKSNVSYKSMVVEESRTLTEKEKKVIDKMKSTPWGTIVIKMKGGKPVMLSATEDIKLD